MVLGKLDHFLISHTNSQWMKDFNVKPETIRLLEENISKLLDNSLGGNLLDLTPKAKATEEKISKWDYIKLETSAQQREPSTK